MVHAEENQLPVKRENVNDQQFMEEVAYNWMMRPYLFVSFHFYLLFFDEVFIFT